LALVLVFTRPWDGQLTPLTVLAERSFQDSVAVVPFETHAPDEDLSTLAGFLTDNITRELKRSDFVRVTPLFSVKQLLKLPLTDAQLADSLEVGRLLVGSLTGVEDSLVLGIDILDFTGDGAGTSLEYRSQLPVTSENAVLLAEGVARDYLSQFSEATLRLAHGPSPFGPGYERLMEGSDALSGRTPSDLARAREAFKEVLDLDPENAHAFAGLSKYYTLADVYRYRTDVERYETAGLAYAHAQRAIALAPNLADGYTARGLIARRSFAPLSDVEADCRQAWEIEPGNAEGLAWCAQTLRLRGADDDGFQLAEQAIRMDPQNAGRRMSLAWIALSIGDYETARQQAHEASRLANEMVLARAVEAYALLLGGAWETCADLDLGPHSVLRATCLHEMGRSEEAEALVDSVKVALEAGTIDDEVFTEVVRTADLAVYYARLGDPSESLRWVTESYERSPSGIDERALQSALFDRVREDPEFSRGLERARAKVWDRVRVAAERAYEDRFGDSGLP
jgi:tetratricopeptide (TPR) repeat protein/TolB-like protein